MTCYPSTTPFGLALGVRLTLGGFTLPRKPYSFGEQDFHLFYRYSSRHNHFHALHETLSVSLRRCVERSSTASTEVEARSFGSRLIPDHYRRQDPRPVSYYALFKWWLLLSQHPGCHGNPTTLVTEIRSGTLSDGLGCFPFDRGNYLPRTDSHDRVLWYSEFG